MAAAHSLPEPMTAWSFPDCSVGQHPAESKLHALKSITSELTLLRENPDTDRAEKALDGFHHTYTLPFADLVVPVEHNSPAGGLTSVSPDKMKHWLYTKLGLDPFSFCCVGCFFFPLQSGKAQAWAIPLSVYLHAKVSMQHPSSSGEN